ncbi:aldehyde dehydrogenase [Lentzea guizhouensis]|uniref:Aldehyde dehydrogenase n=1 Tax=Lentzea guizhouensis TaxID=1586287 RepID=A0A1B2HQ41_9PSEU|nr:aldehyde dehydrogenase family protein [Lentzea guizhouensis]ANZ39833.1 aldehyde dehydrogenase [Lentzea guizhouensis]
MRTTSTAERVSDVTAAALSAFPSLAASSPDHRADLLRRLAQVVEEHRAELVSVADGETHIGAARLHAEVDRTRFQLAAFADVITDGAYLDVVVDRPVDGPPPAGRPDLRRMLTPLGPVAVFAASNFPFAFSVLGGDTASALAAGCPVVVKAHEGHPELSALTCALAADVLPDGVLSLVTGRDAGRALVVDPNITAVGFTGSGAGGRALFDLATGRPDPIPFYGELGSVNPVVVTPAAVAARGEEVAKAFVASFTLGSGQLCTKPGLLFLPAGHGLDEVLRRAVTQVAPSQLLGPWIRDGYLAAVRALARRRGVREIVPLPEQTQDAVSPSLFGTSAATLGEELVAECFGPSALVVEYNSADDLLAALAAVPPSLAAAVHGEAGDDLAATVLGAVRTGRVVWNGWPTGVAVTAAMHHGGPWPATTAPLHTSVGASAIDRWLRPVAYQDMPDELLPPPLRRDNPWHLPRRVDGEWTRRPA